MSYLSAHKHVPNTYSSALASPRALLRSIHSLIEITQMIMKGEWTASHWSKPGEQSTPRQGQLAAIRSPPQTHLFISSRVYMDAVQYFRRQSYKSLFLMASFVGRTSNPFVPDVYVYIRHWCFTCKKKRKSYDGLAHGAWSLEDSEAQTI